MVMMAVHTVIILIIIFVLVVVVLDGGTIEGSDHVCEFFIHIVKTQNLLVLEGMKIIPLILPRVNSAMF